MESSMRFILPAYFLDVKKICFHPTMADASRLFSTIVPHRPGNYCYFLILLLSIFILISPFSNPVLAEPREIAVTSSREWCTKAIEYQSLGKKDQALECLEIALDLNPRNQQALELHETLSGSRSGPVAITTSSETKATKRLAESAGFFKKGKMHLEKGDLMQARDCLEIALEMDENNFEVKGLLDRVIQKIKFEDFRRGRVIVEVPVRGPGSERLHIVKKGDTLGKIAKEYLGSFKSYEEIARYNHFKPKSLLTIGQAIKIPPTENVAQITAMELKEIRPMTPGEIGKDKFNTSPNSSNSGNNQASLNSREKAIKGTGGWYQVSTNSDDSLSMAAARSDPPETSLPNMDSGSSALPPMPAATHPAFSGTDKVYVSNGSAPLPSESAPLKPPIIFKPIPPVRPVRSETIFDKVPKTSGDYMSLSKALWKTGELERAMDNYKKALKMDPSLLSKGQTRLVDEAILKLENRDSGDPEAFANLHFKLAEIYQKRGELEAASQELLRAIELKDNFEEAYFNLGFIYEKLGEADLAIMTYEKINEMFAARDEVVTMATDRMTRLIDIRKDSRP
jgi:tetratricopeptide (TPR) repeat protein